MPTLKRLSWYHIGVGLVLAACLAYMWAFLQRTQIIVQGEPMHALFDDAMISMQYAKNFAHGDGLVWNVGGERIEGYSNPLWVLVMAVVHLFPLQLTETSFYVKLISLACLFINLFMVKGLAEHFSKNRIVPLTAIFLTGFYYSLNNWAIQGMEVGFQAVLLSSALLLGLRGLQRDRFQPWMYVLFGLLVVLRMDSVAPALAATAAFAWIDPANRRKHLLGGALSVFGVLLALTAWRYVYYGELLPNTYYLKLGSGSTVLRISIGLRRLVDFIWLGNWALFALPLLLPLFLDRSKTLWPLYAAGLAQGAYSVYVGGDAWEHIGGANRFISAVMPLFFVLYAHTLGQLAGLALTGLKKKPVWAATLANVLLAAWAGISLLSFNASLVPNGFYRWTLIARPIFTESAQRYAGMGMVLGQITEPQAVIAVVTAGNLPYFSERTSIDLLGKMDPVIARLPAHGNASLFSPGSYRPGHNKWDYAYSIGELQPDVVAQIWDGTSEEAAPYLVNYEKYYIDEIPYYLRKDSPYVRWDALPPQQFPDQN
ncbi:MAG: hypothetical protein KIS88_07995 [Anaerolineales bacterium]|nr:hypothetical protein [Anaerolineales bacterium]